MLVLQGTLEEQLEVAADSRQHLTATQQAVVGLSNVGNTCFFNSSVQLLLSCAPLQQMVLLKDHDITKGPLGYALQQASLHAAGGYTYTHPAAPKLPYATRALGKAMPAVTSAQSCQALLQSCCQHSVRLLRAHGVLRGRCCTHSSVSCCCSFHHTSCCQWRWGCACSSVQATAARAKLVATARTTHSHCCRPCAVMPLCSKASSSTMPMS